MKALNSFFVLMVLALFSFNINAQELEIIVHDTFLYGTQGSEIVFEMDIVNISALEQTVFMVRTLNNLPQGWTSSLCFGEICAMPSIDSVSTTPPNPEPPLQPGDTLKASVHVNETNSIDTAYIQVQIGTFLNPGIRETIDFTATTDPSVDVEDEINLNSYELKQNFPNPFNPSTQINYNVAESGFVNLKVYNILGMEVATLINEYKAAGNHQVSFDGNDLPSGVYIYRISVNDFTKTRKMILEK